MVRIRDCRPNGSRWSSSRESIECVWFAFLKLGACINSPVKRQRENPKRPLEIWAMDTLKQGLAAIIVHSTNVLVSSFIAPSSSMQVSVQTSTTSPCVLYFLHILLDTTIGVFFLYAFLKALHRIGDYFKLEGIDSGFYGVPPKWNYWARQFGLFLSAWFLVKSLVVIAISYSSLLVMFGAWTLGPILQTHNPRLQVLVVMLLFPLVMNIVQAWLIDMLIKGKKGHGPEEDDPLVEPLILYEEEDSLLEETGLGIRPNVDSMSNDAPILEGKEDEGAGGSPKSRTA